MHEIRLAAELSAIVTEVAIRENLSRITRVTLQFGEMIMMVPDIFRFAFDEAVQGTCAQDAEVVIEKVPVSLRCNNCLREFEMGEPDFICANCQSPDLEIIHGKEMVIKSLEGE